LPLVSVGNPVQNEMQSFSDFIARHLMDFPWLENIKCVVNELFTITLLGETKEDKTQK